MRVSKTALVARMLEYFQRVEETGEELIVTEGGEPVLRVLPIRRRRPAREVFGDLQGKVRYAGDILGTTTDEWADL